MIHKDTIEIIEWVHSKFEIDKHIDCYILCLKIIQKVLDVNPPDNDPHNLIKLLIKCLTAMSQNIGRLSRPDKEIYYLAVKKLVRLIHQNHQDAI